jgi:hypothetical protein
VQTHRRQSGGSGSAEHGDARSKAAEEEADYHGTALFAPECTTLQEIERLLGKPVPQLAEIVWNTFGFMVVSGHITELGLCRQHLSSLPETIKRILKEMEKHGCKIVGIEI